MRFRIVTLSLVLSIAGCSMTGLPQDGEAPVEMPVPEPVVDEPAPAPPPEPQPAPAPAPEPAPPPEPPPSTFTPPVAVVLSSRAPAYERVATALESLLSKSEIYDLSDRSLLPHEMIARIESSDARAVVTIGLRATLLARDQVSVPVIFAQVFNVSEHELEGATIRGVSVLPPLDVQLDVWRTHSPGIESVGAIVGAGHEGLLDEARKAALSAGLEFHHRIAESDRETLYLFNRLVPEIDAFWLFPDNRILSADVLREMLSYAAAHRVEVAVFNESLLDIGPGVSTSADESDIARMVVLVLNRIDAGEIDDVPGLTPLNEVRLTIGDTARGTAARRERPAAQDESP